MPTTLSVDALLAERQWIEDLARQIVRDSTAAQDVAQEAWRRALSRPPREVTSARGWLFALVTSCARDLRRSEARREVRERGAARPERIGAVDLVARAEAHRRVLDAVLALDPASRAVVLLRYFEDLSPSQIARRTGEPAGTVRSRLHRALATLRGKLAAGDGPGSAPWAVAMLGRDACEPHVGFHSSVLKGGIVMTAKTKAALAAAAAALLLLGLAWNHADAGRAPPVAGGTAEAGESRRSPKVRDPQTEASAALPAPAAPAVVPAREPVGGPRRLAIRVLPPREPEAAPDIPGRRVLDASGQVVAIEAPDERDAAGEINVGGGTMRSAGWTKWKPVPETGSVTLSGRVVDLLGAPLAGAEVVRVEREAGGSDGDVVDYTHMVVIGETRADGTFEIREQPARGYRLASNWHETMGREGGLLLHGLVAVEPREGERLTGLRLEVAVTARDFGAVTGRVLDEDGEPLRQPVSCGYVSAMSSARDGSFRLWPVPAGAATIVCDDYGAAPTTRRVTVRAGLDTEIEIRVTPAATGDLEISGVVIDDDESTVAGLPFWCGGIEDVSRRTLTGPDGSFRFRHLPPAPKGQSYSLSTLALHQEVNVLHRTVPGFAAPSRDLVFRVERTVPLRIVLRDAATLSPLPLFNVSVERDEVVDGTPTRVRFEYAALHEPDGSWTVRVPRTEIILFAEAPDHRPFHGAVTIPRDGGDLEVVLELSK